MNKEAAMRSVRVRKRWTIVPVIAGLLGLSSIAVGQIPSWLDPERPHAQAREALVEHLSGKYRVESAEVKAFPRDNSVVWQSLSSSGDFTPKAPVTPEPGEHGKARAVARAFLQQEAAALFGIAPADIRAAQVWKGMPGAFTQTGINYSIYVGDLPLRGAKVQVDLDGDERIRRVDADLPPIPDALRQAVKRPTLDEQRIRRLVQADIEADAQSPDVPWPVKRYMTDPLRRSTEAEKLAIPAPPYVIWQVRSIWRYEIDAFTGKILSKTPGWFPPLIEPRQ